MSDDFHADVAAAGRSLRHRRLLVIVLVYAAAFRVAVLDRPFYYDSEATGGAFSGICARNYLRFSWRETRGMPIVTVGRLLGMPPAYYPDHPPIVPLLIVPVYGLFGEGEWQTRLPTSLATLFAIVTLYRLLERF